jgi:hypothetical protein
MAGELFYSGLLYSIIQLSNYHIVFAFCILYSVFIITLANYQIITLYLHSVFVFCIHYHISKLSH